MEKIVMSHRLLREARDSMLIGTKQMNGIDNKPKKKKPQLKNYSGKIK